MDLTPRQTQILKAIIDEYISSADAVGSETLERKYSLGISPATIRNEMSELTEKGFLQQLHTSAGRIPTSMGLRFYVGHLMQEKQMSLRDEVSCKEEIWDARFNLDKLLRETVLALSKRTHTLAVATTNDGNVYYAGASQILNMPEFYDIDVAQTVLSLLDQRVKLQQLFFGQSLSSEPIHIMFGTDLNWPNFATVGMVFSRFNAGKTGDVTLGIIGPCRLNFPYVVPTIRYFSQLVGEIAQSF
ncbi:hypothetical protein HZB69_00515 [Candidatus Amesbacteria bacterium]|nr:hypothetical protein [Candidatus Amesbacteria bacterium]